MAAIEIQGLSKRFGSVRAVRTSRSRSRRAGSPASSGPTEPARARRSACSWAWSARRGDARFDGQRLRDLEHPSAHVGAVLEDASFHPGRTGRNHLRDPRRRRGPPARAGRGGPRADRHRRRRQPPGQGLLDGDAPAPRDRGRAARRPRRADPRRARQRARPPGIRWMRDMLRPEAGRGRAVLISSHLLSEVSQTSGRRRRHLPRRPAGERAARAGRRRARAAEPCGCARRIATGLARRARRGGHEHRDDLGGAAGHRRDAAMRSAPPRTSKHVALSELVAVSRSLEDVFLELTGSEEGGR